MNKVATLERKYNAPSTSTANPLRTSLTHMGIERGSNPTDNIVGNSLEKTTEYLLCHYFDYVAGTSTGG